MQNGTPQAQSERSSVLPSDVFDLTMSSLMGHPNGAHTSPAAVQTIDWYGNVATFLVQTVKTDLGNYVFIQEMNAKEPKRYILPPKVLATIDRQAETVSTIVRRRHGRRLAEERAANGTRPVFTPAMRAKALATRKANARKRAQRRAGK